MANLLIISLYTVETTIKNVYAKLGVNNVAGLAEWYYGWKFGIADQIQDTKNKAIAKVEKKKEATKNFVKVLPKTLLIFYVTISFAGSMTANELARSTRRMAESRVEITTSRRQSRRRERRINLSDTQLELQTNQI